MPVFIYQKYIQMEENKMKEPWVVFYDKKGNELSAYTMRGTFAGERKATIEMLAAEKGIPEEDINIKILMR